MDDLREKMVRLILADDYFDGLDEHAAALADAILALPEIAEALDRPKVTYFSGGSGFMVRGGRIRWSVASDPENWTA